MSRRSPFAALRDDRTVQAVAALVVLGLLARLALLGQRVAHQDEARVGYWTVRYLVSGRWEYRPIVHGPFIPIVNRHLFALFGPSDFVARLPMAVVGALAPGVALLFRTRLRDSEVVALAFLLAFNPVLLYYSRFMRQDVPLAVFMLFALGLFVRAIDAGRPRTRRRYLYAGAFAFGLAFTTKENALLYPLSWAGAAVLLFDHRLFRARVRDSTPIAVAASYVPDPPENAPFDLDPGLRIVALLAFLGANPAALAVVGLDSEALLLAGVVVGLASFLVALRGATVWHFVPALGMGWTVVALPTGILTPAEAAFWFALWWILAGLMLVDERLFDHGAVARSRRGPTLDPEEASRATTGKDREAAAPAREAATDDRGGVAPDGGRPGEPRDRDGPDDRDTDGRGDRDPDDHDPGRRDDGDSADDGADPAGNANPADEAAPETAREAGDDGGWDLRWRSAPPLGVAYLLALAVVVFFYAPRGGGYPAPVGDATVGLWGALASFSPGALNAVFWESTFDTWELLWGTWAAGGHQDHAYIPYFKHYANSLATGALVVSVAGAVGFLLDRYAPDGPRDLVAFAGYWGVASVLGYPLVTDIQAAWTTVHAIVPLAIPAAVAVALVYRIGRDALADDDPYAVGAAVLVLLLVGVQVGYAAGTGVYMNPQSPDNQLVQYAQSSSTDMKPVLRDVREIARENEGVDVLFYGDEFDSADESHHDQPPAGPGWFERLPIAWYLEAYDYRLRKGGANVTVSSTLQQSEVRNSDAPVVIALRETEGRTVSYSGQSIEEHLDGYRRYDGHRFLYDTGVPSSIAIYVDTSLLEDPRGDYDRTVTNRSSGASDRLRPQRGTPGIDSAVEPRRRPVESPISGDPAATGRVPRPLR